MLVKIVFSFLFSISLSASLENLNLCVDSTEGMLHECLEVMDELTYFDIPKLKHVVPTVESEDNFFSCITNREEHFNVSAVTKTILCMIVRERDLGSVTIVSGARLKSYHHPDHLGKTVAVDFYFDKYTGKMEDNAQKYIDDLFEIVQYLKSNKIGFLIGFGVYPPACKDGEIISNGLTFHLDARGIKARWARINGKYVSILDGLEEFKKALKGC